MELEEDWKGDRQSRNPCPSHAMCILPKRYMVAVMSLLGFANIYAMRVNLSVAIAVMVANHTVLRDGQEVEVQICCFAVLCRLLPSLWYTQYVE